MWRHLRLLAVIATIMVAGCSDKYSQRRIEMRQQALQDQARDIESLEKHRINRLHEVGPALGKWWRQDEEQFRQRAEAAGDYLW